MSKLQTNKLQHKQNKGKGLLKKKRKKKSLTKKKKKKTKTFK